MTQKLTLLEMRFYRPKGGGLLTEVFIYLFIRAKEEIESRWERQSAGMPGEKPAEKFRREHLPGKVKSGEGNRRPGRGGRLIAPVVSRNP